MKSFLLLASLFAASVCAHAVTITSGNFTTDLVNGQFHFISSSFDLEGTTGIGFFGGLQTPVAPGTVVNPSGVVGGTDIGSGSGWVGGTFYPSLLFGHVNGLESSFEFTAPSFTYTGESSITVPFQFSGSLTVYESPFTDPDSCLLCLVPIKGSGYTVIRYNVPNNPGDPVGLGFPIDQTFVFTPEPATAFLLIPAGFLFFLARKRINL